ncbi:MAG: terminase family protein [Lactococcus sp.]|nr:terminase family protein [Lactococcus sp.]MDN5411115.1 terminase family protein [Lactococcus sp.]MDN5445942.1 terminase family protein [Lactococcus lactis]MDN5467893.1 terminase family protein [Lactococcus raffinolactis]
MNEKKKQYLTLIQTNPVKFGNLVGFNDLVDIHNEWLKSFLFVNEDQTLLAHRGSYKTTTLAGAIALLMILFPNKNLIFLRKTDTDVVEIIVQVAKILKSDYFQTLAKVLYGVDLILLKETTTEIDTNLKSSSRGTSQLLGMGIYASLTGKHADIVITDDIVNIKDRVSKAERERTKLQYQELQNVKNRGGRFINTGTPWHRDDAISKMPNVQRFDCYQTGLITDDQLQKLRDVMTSSLFAANYELKHIADADAMFTNPTVDDGTNTEQIYDGIGQLDAAFGGADGTAYTVIKGRDDTLYVYGKLWPGKHVDDCLSEISKHHANFRAGTMHLELNADKGYVAKKVEAMSIPTNTYHEKENKFIKISTYLRSNWSKIIFIKGTDPDYINEILDYTENAEHDDAPDSLATAIRAISNANKLQSFDISEFGFR